VKKILEKFLRFLGYNFNFYRIEFNDPLSKFHREQKEKSYQNFKKFFITSYLASDRKIREFSLKKSIEDNKNLDNSLFLEFGVYKGASINQFANILAKKNVTIFGFDSFKGITEDWLGTNKLQGHYSNLGNIPQVEKNVKLIVGDIYLTLEKFINENMSKKISFVHIDTDTYKVCKYILEKLKPIFYKNAVIVFDELHNFSAWDIGEYKALNEVFNEAEYKYIAFGSKSNAAIKLNL
jgi:hypothetical protein